MSDSDDIKQSIVESAKAGISRVRVGNQEVEGMTTDEQMKAAQFASNAANQTAFGLRFRKMRGPGCGS